MSTLGSTIRGAYDLETLAKDLSAHLVFGTATAAAFRLLAHGELDR
jgi:hypothetical protein